MQLVANIIKSAGLRLVNKKSRPGFDSEAALLNNNYGYNFYNDTFICD
jgi:hypothetical protein